MINSSGTAISRVDGREHRFPYAAGLHDVLSYQWLMRRQLASGMRQFSYELIDKDERKTYQFQVEGRQQLELPYQTLETIHIRRTDNPAREVEFWVAPALNYLVVKISHHDDGRIFSSQLLKLTYEEEHRAPLHTD